MSKDKKYLESASVGMALMDAVPVLLFCGSAFFVGSIFNSVLFKIGAILCIAAGASKVLWKLILATAHKNIVILNRQFPYVMGGGFLIILLSLFVGHNSINMRLVWKNVSAFPGNILFIIGIICMIAMFIFTIFMDASSKRDNYIEQGVNLAAQLCFFLGVMLIWYASDYYRADETALTALNGSDEVNIINIANGNIILFDGEGTDTALIFYPGAKVEYTSYAPLMLELAENGIDCFVVEMPYNMAIFGLNSADKLIKKYSDADFISNVKSVGIDAAKVSINNSFPYTHWYIGGHSLGGAMAASYASKHTDELDGLVLLAAYPTASLDADNFKVISIYGSNDGVLNRDKYNDSLKYMPADFNELVIDGGNHAGFGSYGAQAGDGEAGISWEEQWRQTTDEIVNCILNKTIVKVRQAEHTALNSMTEQEKEALISSLDKFTQLLNGATHIIKE